MDGVGPCTQEELRLAGFAGVASGTLQARGLHLASRRRLRTVGGVGWGYITMVMKCEWQGRGAGGRAAGWMS
jgi:hypothetical protein